MKSSEDMKIAMLSYPIGSPMANFCPHIFSRLPARNKEKGKAGWIDIDAQPSRLVAFDAALTRNDDGVARLPSGLVIYLSYMQADICSVNLYMAARRVS